MLAESMQLDGGLVALVLTVLVLGLAVIVGGFVLAPYAGRGSRAALVIWVVIIAFESLTAIALLLSGGGLIFVLMIAGQVWLYVRARRPGG